MSRMNTLTLFTLFLATTLRLTSAEDPDPLEVQYKSETFVLPSGSSVKLSCLVYYDPAQCGQIHAAWFHLEPGDSELTDPEKYTTVVNESIADNNWRRRRVLTEVLDLRSEDKGSYQCKGVIENGRSFMGHLIEVIVKD